MMLFQTIRLLLSIPLLLSAAPTIGAAETRQLGKSSKSTVIPKSLKAPKSQKKSGKKGKKKGSAAPSGKCDNYISPDYPKMCETFSFDLEFVEPSSISKSNVCTYPNGAPPDLPELVDARFVDENVGMGTFSYCFLQTVQTFIGYFSFDDICDWDIAMFPTEVSERIASFVPKGSNPLRLPPDTVCAEAAFTDFNDEGGKSLKIELEVTEGSSCASFADNV